MRGGAISVVPTGAAMFLVATIFLVGGRGGAVDGSDVVLVRSEAGLRQTRIVHGAPLAKGEKVEWQVSLMDSKSVAADIIPTSFRPVCGGSLVRQEWVVTAAHCFPDPTKVSNMRVHVNASLLTAELVSSQSDQLLKISEVIIHEKFETNEYHNDIALLRIEREENYSDLHTIKLGDFDVKATSSCFISGFGTTSFHGLISPILLKAPIKVNSDEDCQKFTSKSLGVSIFEGQFCAGGGNTDACQGDSGGPLLCCPKLDITSKNCTLEGVVSYGQDCGVIGNLGVYSKVGYHKQWLLGKMDAAADQTNHA